MGQTLFTENKTLKELLSQAIKAHTEFNLTKAIDLYNQILEREPENTNVLSNLGRALFVAGTQTVLKGDADQNYRYAAQETFIKAATLEKRSNKHKAEKLVDLAKFYLQLYKIESSIKFGELAYTLNPKSSNLHNYRDAYRVRCFLMQKNGMRELSRLTLTV